MTRIGILHPGDMGISIAASAMQSGHAVYWTSQKRSAKTRQRADQYHLKDAGSLAQLCQTCEIILCVCPPHAAEAVALSVLEQGFKGWYLDANAISPQHAIQIGQKLEAHGIRFVDGGIIGGPAWKPNETFLYLSGAESERIAACFTSGPLTIKIISDTVGKASALKMCYAAYSKGTTALLAGILAAAEHLGVRDELYQQWEQDEAGFSEQVNRRVRRVTAKAWRFEGEMLEIAGTFQEAGLHNGFQQAAAETYRRMARFKDAADVPALDEVLSALLSEQKRP